MNAKELLSWLQQEGRELRKVLGTVAVALVLAIGATAFVVDRLYDAKTQALEASNQTLRDRLGGAERSAAPEGAPQSAVVESAADPDRVLSAEQTVMLQRTLRGSLSEHLEVAVTRVDCTDCRAELRCRDCGTLQAQISEALDGVKLINVTQPFTTTGGTAPDESPEGLIVRGHGTGSDALAAALTAAGLTFSRQSIPTIFPAMPGESTPPFQAEIVISRRSIP